MAKPRVEMKVVLRYVNRIRQAMLIGQGEPLDELPKGEVRVPESCVIALALSNGWKCTANESYLHFRHKGRIDARAMVTALAQQGFEDVRIMRRSVRETEIEMATPVMVANFIERFDNGDFPELVLTDS